MFAVLYRWKLKPGTEAAFREAWCAATEAIRTRYGTGGSRLHRTEDDEVIAYAVWPSRADWEKAQNDSATLPDASDRMRACVAVRVSTTPLDVIDDLLGSLPVAAA